MTDMMPDKKLLTSNTALAVSCHGITKRYGEGDNQIHALRGIDLDVYQGELMMMVGPSGCGKTTLISILAGILDQNEGECLVFGENIKKLSHRARIDFRARNVGFVFQSFNLIPALTAAENVAIPLQINGMPEARAISKASEYLQEVGLAGRENSLPAQLSGGQQQRVAIARALVHNPRLVVCDEPTSALDHVTGHKVMDIMKHIAVNQDRTLIIVTHDARIFSFADRIAHMDDGRIVQVDQNVVEKNTARSF
ncbi:MAG TPA: ABC transporter ATP-binding protein [Pseudomonadales bacterium]|nr:ABC transporter ATP-binding protein [Pseudomonadales bacterium]